MLEQRYYPVVNGYMIVKDDNELYTRLLKSEFIYTYENTIRKCAGVAEDVRLDPVFKDLLKFI